MTPDAGAAGGVPGARGRLAVRLAFAAVALLFALQVVLIGGGAGEPYPGILMPGFSGSGGYADGAVRIERMEAALGHAAGETTVSQRRLLEPYPDSHHNHISAYLLSLPRAEPRPLREALRRTVFPGLAAGRVAREAGAADPSLCAWARDRAAAFLPGARVGWMEIRWHRDTFRAGSRAPAARVPLGRLRIPLDREGGCGG